MLSFKQVRRCKYKHYHWSNGYSLFKVEDSLKEIKDQTNAALTTVASQSKKVDESLASLETVLKDLEESDAKRDEDFKNVKNDIESLKELVPKVTVKQVNKKIKSNRIFWFYLGIGT